MTDLALVFDTVLQTADFAMAGPDLQLDDGLRTAVIISLLTDRLAQLEDDIPDGTTDRRGWWGDLPVDGEDVVPIGSRLWLLSRAKATEDTRKRAEGYVREALQWLLDDGVAETLQVATSWRALGFLDIRVTTIRGGASRTFDVAWRAEIAR